MRQYLYAAIFGVPFGMLIGFLMWLIMMREYPWWWPTFLGVAIWPIALLSEVYWHRYVVYSYPYEMNTENMGINHNRIIRLKVPISKADDICRESLKKVPGCRLHKRFRFTPIIKGCTGYQIRWVGPRWWLWTVATYGETITFNISKIDDSTTRIMVNSKPTFPLVWLDYGKSLDCIEKVMRTLHRYEAKQVDDNVEINLMENLR